MINPFFIIILATLLVEFFLGLIADLLNLKSLRMEVPPELDGIYKPEEYRKSQEYTRVTTRFGFVTGIFGLVVLLAFWFSGGFNYLDEIVRSWRFVPAITGLFYIGIIMVAYNLITLPFSIYGTFVIEERFGFNRTTPGTFISDRIKGMVLSLVIGAPLLAGILLFFQYLGTFAWVYCWIAAMLFTLIMQFIAPTLIMPMFNKFTPMEPGELKDAICKFTDSVKFPVKNIYVIDGSKRSSKSNAFFTGFGRNKRIALFDTLIAGHTVNELVAVLAHEIGHYKKKHIMQDMVIGVVHAGVMFFLLSIFLDNTALFNAFGMQHKSIYAGLMFFGMLYGAIELVLSIGMQMLSRRNETQADRFAAEKVDEPQSMIDALKKLSANNLSNLTPHPLYVFLNYSHPPLLQRIRTIKNVSDTRAGHEIIPAG